MDLEKGNTKHKITIDAKSGKVLKRWAGLISY